MSFCLSAHLARRLSGHESRGEVAAERLKSHTHRHADADSDEDRSWRTPNCFAPALLLLGTIL